MANYKNSLGESELFGRMTAGFAKICESVQSGKFVRDEMGVICESVCEDNEESYPDHIDITPEEYAELDGSVKDLVAVYGEESESYGGEKTECVNHVYSLILWWIANKVGCHVETAYKCEDIRINLLDENGKRVQAFNPMEFAKKEVGLDYFEALVSPPDEIRLEDVNDDGATAGAEGATQDADVASATPEQINGSVTECGNAGKKPMKKLIPEGCCGGKAKKVLKECGSTVVTEKKVPLCKTCGNPLDETGTCQDCQGYSPVKEGDGEIKLQIPAELKRKAALKANAQANKEKVAQAIRDGKVVGIVKEGLDDRKGADKITKDVVFGMLVNLLYQLRDGASVEEVTANPDMEEFDDYTLDEVLELAKKYEV